MELENLIPISTFLMLCTWNLRTSLKLLTRYSSLAYRGKDPNLLEPVNKVFSRLIIVSFIVDFWIIFLEVLLVVKQTPFVSFGLKSIFGRALT